MMRRMIGIDGLGDLGDERVGMLSRLLSIACFL
jgi:hypothetical protein